MKTVTNITAEGIHVDNGGIVVIAPLPERIELTEEGNLPEGVELTEAEIDAALAYEPPAPPAPVPQEVGAGQIRAAMITTGIAPDLATLNATFESFLAGNEIGLALWRHATSFKRDYPLIEAARIALGKTTEEVDDLFRLAATF